MYKERLHKAWILLYGLGMIALGIIILVQGEILINPAASIVGALIAAHGIHRIIKSAREKRRSSLIGGIGNVAIGLLTFFLPGITVGILSVIFSLYILLNALVKFIDFCSSIQNVRQDAFIDFIASLFFLTFGIIMLFGRFMGHRGILVVSGIYSVLYGVTQLMDFSREVIPNRTKTAIRRKVRISLPLFMSTFVPLGVLKSYKQRLDSREIDIEKLISEEKLNDKEGEPNIHVLIHVSDDGVGMMGHCDLYIDGEVLSYGNYDASSERLFGALGDGVMFTADLEAYVSYSIKYDNQMIFDYGLMLTDEQIEKVRAEIARLKSKSYRWKPPYQTAKENGENVQLSDFKDYCSRLWDGTGASFYKFRSGRFKSYFLMTTNCVLLADSILSKAGTDIVRIVGIISPGAYYDYLQTEYRLENGIAVTRDIYSKYKELDFKAIKNDEKNDV